MFGKSVKMQLFRMYWLFTAAYFSPTVSSLILLRLLHIILFTFGEEWLKEYTPWHFVTIYA